ncbi:MAG TPA: helix-turn-helix domain-containing protein [Xanthobacteraceae bacterium]|nr:helix-turn-helix domain-containing protein [Xanthobacteraceae bacterium]
MPRIWSTGDVHPRDRVAYWLDGLCDTIVNVDCEPRSDQPFFGKIRADSAGEIHGSTYSSVAQIITRSPRKIAHRPADMFTLGMQLVGHGFGSQDGRDLALRPGDLVLYDMTRPLRLTFSGSFVRTTLIFPRAALLRRLGAAERFIGRSIDGTVGVGGMLSPLVRKLPSHLDTIPDSARERVADNLLDLIATALLSDSEGTPLSTGMTLVRAKLWIETHLGEALSAERIAGACRLSARHLNRLFEREGTSLMRYVWDRRLARCHQDVTDPAMRGRQVGEIAFAAGFSDRSHFSRAYRARYGCAPRDARFAAVAAR